MPTKFKRRVRKNAKAQTTSKLSSGHYNFAGSTSPIGYTSDLNDSATLGRIDKNLFGLFSGTNRTIIEGDIRSSGTVQVLEPLFPYKDLLKIYLSNSILRQCIDSYKTNIEGFGSTFEYIGPEGQQSSRAAKNEKARLQRVLSKLVDNGETLKQARENSRVDKEVVGARAFEVIRDVAGRTVRFNRVPIATLRMTKRDKKSTEYTSRDPDTGAVNTFSRRFRRFLQVTEEGEAVWFKELGDPRSIDPETGEENNDLPISAQATSIYYEGIYTPGTPYGTPRWAGVISSMLGSKEAEMVNLNFFRDNAIPAMAVLVSGGALTEESFEKIKQYIDGVRGAKSMNRIVVLEASADAADNAAIDGSLPAPKVDIKPMLSERQHDGLFENYINSADTKVRSCFRLPPLYVGSAKEYNRASAFASVLVAEQQVFDPERMDWDVMFHEQVLSTHSPRYWRLRTNSATINDPQEVSRLVTSLGKEGALTPNIVIKIANRYLDADIEQIMQKWGDTPFSVISSYVGSGKTIPGLDIFIKDVQDVSTDNDLSDNDEAGNTAQLIAEEIADQLSQLVQKASLQPVAAE